jgi:hypothetical protein
MPATLARIDEQVADGVISAFRSKTSGFVRPFGGVASAVRVRACASELTAIDDQVLLTDRPPREPALQNLACTRRITRLR